MIFILTVILQIIISLGLQKIGMEMPIAILISVVITFPITLLANIGGES
jgi:hypothetical protein